MSAWPEAAYVINKINYSLDALFDINYNGIENINNLNNRIDQLNEQINSTEPKGLMEQQRDIQTLLSNLDLSIVGFEEDYNQAVTQLEIFENNLEEADHRIIYIGTQTECNNLEDVSNYAIALIKS